MSRHTEQDEEVCPKCQGYGYLDKTTNKPMTEEEQKWFPDYKKACPTCGGRGVVKKVRRKLLVEDNR